MTMKPNILLTSAGRRSYIVDYFKQSGKYNKIFASNSEYTIALQCADEYVLTPLIYSDEYIPFLIHYCRDNSINIVLSLFDIDCYMLAQHRSEFENNGICLVGGDAEFVKICNDKYSTSLWAVKHGFSSPQTFLTVDAAVQAIMEGELNYPVMIKPRWGMGSIGIYIVDDEDELRLFAKKCIDKTKKTFLRYESSLTPQNPIIIQELIDGDEYALDIVNDLQGNYITTHVTKKYEMRGGETFMGMVVENESLMQLGHDIGVISSHSGILSLDIMSQNNGKQQIIDLNCRISGTYPIVHLAGFDFPKLLADMYTNGNVNSEYLHVKYNQIVIKDLTPKVLNILQ